MPPPSKTLLARIALPSLIVRPLMLTFTLGATSNTRELPPPLTFSRPAPRPRIVTSLVMFSSPLVSVIVWKSSCGSKAIVVLFLARAISARSEPGPLSLVLVTVSVLGTSRPSRASSRGRKPPGLPPHRRSHLPVTDGLRDRSQDGNHMTLLLEEAARRATKLPARGPCAGARRDSGCWRGSLRASGEGVAAPVDVWAIDVIPAGALKVAAEVAVADRQTAGVVDAAAIVAGLVVGQGATTDRQRAGVVDAAAVADGRVPGGGVVAGQNDDVDACLEGVVDAGDDF